MQKPLRSNIATYLLPEEKDILQAYYDSAGVGWLVSSLEGIILNGDQRFWERFGYTLNELQGKNINEFIRVENPNESERFLGEKFISKCLCIKSDGSKHNSAFSTKIIDDPKIGSFRVWFINCPESVCQIVNHGPLGDKQEKSGFDDRANTETEVYEKSKILNGIVNNLPVIIFKIDETGEFILLQGSRNRIELFKKSRTAKLSIKVALKQGRKKLQQSTSSDDYFSFSSTYLTNDSEWHFENFMFKEPYGNNTFAGFSIEITDRKNAEQEMKRHAKSLQKINKELDQFAYVVSHDLKAPLRAINNLSEWIEEDMGMDVNPDIKNNFKLLRGRVKRLQALVDGILEYSRIGRIHVQSELVDTNKLLMDLIDNLGIPDNFQIIKKNVLPVIHANKLRLEQVFMNLISNAIKHHDRDMGNIEIDYNKTGHFHQFSVKDDGPGIAPQYHEKVFLIFQVLQPRDMVESTGVGLSIVKKIIEEQGGKVWIESEVGKGATFFFSLPESNG